MTFFVLRNSTVESLFDSKNTAYSGYGDISTIDQTADIIIWFYMLPLKSNTLSLVLETEAYFNQIQWVNQQVPSHKWFLIFTLQNLYSVSYQTTDFSVELAINRFNANVIEFASKHNNVKVIPFSDFIKKYDREQWIDWKYYFLSKMQLNPRLAKAFGSWFSLQLEQIQLKRKKCLILDLDNTLWGGILGEDGVNGIQIGGDYPGNAFLMFQEYLLELSKAGIILTLCSKNNEQDVLEVWEKNPYLILLKEHFAAYRLNWNNKADNIKELADELNIGLNSMVFVDDNPTERELVKQLLPMVEVPDFPLQPYQLPLFATSLTDRYFKVYTLTTEDKEKTIQYKANASRLEAQKQFVSFEAYLTSLEMELTIEPANVFNVVRIAQMTQKTNQFNLTTKRYTDIEIQALIESGAKIYCLSVKDRFGDSGITGCIIIKRGVNNHDMSIDSFLLSCRILGKGIEVAFITKIIDILRSEGVERLSACFIPTQKNTQVADFYDKMGFSQIREIKESKGEKNYSINIVRKTVEIAPYYKITVS
jgi:FkbH-like protein